MNSPDETLMHHADIGTIPSIITPAADVNNPCPERVLGGAQRGSSGRLKWEPISVIQIGANKKVLHPFLLKKDNWMDEMLVRTMLVEKPFAVPYGKQGLAWKACANALNKTQDPNGKLVYGRGQGFSDKTLKKRFDELMAFVKKADGLVPFQSGMDDQSGGPGQLQRGLEDLYEQLYASFGEEAKTASTASLAKKADDKAKAEALRNASMGMLTAHDKGVLGIAKVSGNDGGVQGRKRAKSHPPSEIRALIDLSKEKANERNANKKVKEARKSAKQKLEFEIRKQELEYKVEQEARAHEFQMAQMALQNRMLRFFERQEEERENK
jgi:hypothetical protein